VVGPGTRAGRRAGRVPPDERGVVQGQAGGAGLLVRTRAGEPVVYVICEPSTRYYRVMTRAEWMPVLIDEVI
jgi:hypothetical protein